MRTPEIRKLEEGTGLWREEEAAAEVIPAISNHRSSTGENPGQQRPETRTPQPSAPSTKPGCGEVWRSDLGRGQVARWQRLEVFQCLNNQDGQHSGFEGLVEMIALAPWKGCPGERVRGTA